MKLASLSKKGIWIPCWALSLLDSAGHTHTLGSTHTRTGREKRATYSGGDGFEIKGALYTQITVAKQFRTKETVSCTAERTMIFLSGDGSQTNASYVVSTLGDFRVL
ncbi:hypothetical protein ACS0TY_031048 [Phlomoides rotata]